MKINSNHVVFIAIIASVLLLEVGIRIFENNLSGNLNHINEIPDIVGQYKEDQRPKILFLGNSLINESVDVNQLSKSLSDQYMVDKITPDATSLWDWNMIMKNQVFASEVKLDYLVIGFAWGLLSDQYQPNPSRLGGYFSELSDGILLKKYGMDTFAQFSEFLLGSLSKLFVNREAVRNKVLVNLVPHYEQFVRAQNQAGRPDDVNVAEQEQYNSAQYKIINSLLDRLDEDGVKLIILSMPIEDDYSVPPELTDLLNSRAYKYIDYRKYFRGTDGVYKDGVHLNDKGRALFTAELKQYFSQDI
ncbi:MAG: hypothetical protein ABW105_03750 [Candidatus Thiodiazotropha sp. 6PLUC1]